MQPIPSFTAPVAVYIDGVRYCGFFDRKSANDAVRSWLASGTCVIKGGRTIQRGWAYAKGRKIIIAGDST